MQASTGMYGLGAGVLIIGAVMGGRYAIGFGPAASSAQSPAPAQAAAPAFAHLTPRPALPLTAAAADAEKPRYFGPQGMSLLVAGPGRPEGLQGVGRATAGATPAPAAEGVGRPQ